MCPLDSPRGAWVGHDRGCICEGVSGRDQYGNQWRAPSMWMGIMLSTGTWTAQKVEEGRTCPSASYLPAWAGTSRLSSGAWTWFQPSAHLFSGLQTQTECPTSLHVADRWFSVPVTVWAIVWAQNTSPSVSMSSWFCLSGEPWLAVTYFSKVEENLSWALSVLTEDKWGPSFVQLFLIMKATRTANGKHWCPFYTSVEGAFVFI